MPLIREQNHSTLQLYLQNNTANTGSNNNISSNNSIKNTEGNNTTHNVRNSQKKVVDQIMETPAKKVYQDVVFKS